jgi:hypothetical protein
VARKDTAALRVFFVENMDLAFRCVARTRAITLVAVPRRCKVSSLLQWHRNI